MANLARPIHRSLTSPQTNANRGKTRVLLLRQPIKSVQREDQASTASFRLSLGVACVVGVIAAVWLIGFLGFRLGFARAIGLPDLLSEPGGGLATGAMVILGYPARVLEAGLIETMWLMLAFALMLLPAGGLAGVRPQVKGGPRPTQLFVTMSWTGAIAAAVMAAVYVAYLIAPFRLAWTTTLPSDLNGIDRWLNGWALAAAIDGLALIGSVLWVVLVFRVTVPVWMKAIAASMCIFAVIATAIASGMTGATAAQLHADRPIVLASDIHPQPSLLLGETRTHSVVMYPVEQDPQTIRMTAFDLPMRIQIVERKSIAELLLEHMPEE